MTYQLTNPVPGATHDAVRRLSDGASVPLVDGNADYAGYLAWLAEGNEPLAAEGPTQSG